MSTIERNPGTTTSPHEPAWTLPDETTAAPASATISDLAAARDARIAEHDAVFGLSTPGEQAPAFAFDVAIVGLGYVGLPTALSYFASGARVLALELSPTRIHTITSRTADLLDSDRERLVEALGDDRFQITTDATLLGTAAAIIVCVPTPVDDYLVPDLSALRAACRTVVDGITHGQLVMLTSTSYVGCTEDLLVTPLTDRGHVVGRDVYVAFSAERIDPGNDSFAQEDVPRVMGAATEECEEEAERLLRRYAHSVHRVHSLAAAEMTKLLENTFRAVNIALINEFADICGALDISVSDVITAASTKPYGFMPFFPGPGVGGHCIPCDPHYLLWQLRRLHMDAPMINQAMTQIAARPSKVVGRIRSLLSEAGVGVPGTRVVIVGVTYKPDVDDLRESPALEIIASLDALGADVAYIDAHVPSLTLPSGRTLVSLADPAGFDARLVLVHTRHSVSDLSWVDPRSIIIDATYKGIDLPTGVAL